MSYDILVIGGGIAGAGFASAMACQGAKVLVSERTPAFSDRVRGEALIPWGVEEAQRLGVYQCLVENCGNIVQWWSTREARRDLFATTRSGHGFLDFYHPDMQQCLLTLAAHAGATIWRPAEAVEVTPGELPSAIIRYGDTAHRVSARLIVAADGRGPRMRQISGFSLQRDEPCMEIAGVLHCNLAIAEDTAEVVLNPARQELAIFLPPGGRRYRSYFARRRDRQIRLSGAGHADTFLRCCIGSGAPPFEAAEAIGPLVPDQRDPIAMRKMIPQHAGVS